MIFPRQRTKPAPTMVQGTLNRTLTLAARCMSRAGQLLTEAALALYDPEFERAALNHAYGDKKHYLTRANQQLGLFPFESRVLQAHFPACPARLLVHGAGAGREWLALRQLGFAVDAFEPVTAMVAAATAADPGAPPIRCASLQSWSTNPSGQYDGVITGWGMWTHVLQHCDRLKALRAFRQVCPHGPVLLSFWRIHAVADHRESTQTAESLYPAPRGRLHRLTRCWLRQRVLGKPPLERGTGWHQGLYFHLVSEDELRQEAASAGYDLVFFEPDLARYGHAVLRPRTTIAGVPHRP